MPSFFKGKIPVSLFLLNVKGKSADEESLHQVTAAPSKHTIAARREAMLLYLTTRSGLNHILLTEDVDLLRQ